MDNQIHIHLHVADASTINLADLIAQATGAAPRVTQSAEASTRTFYVAVYNSTAQRFALGHKLYDTYEAASRNSSHPRFNSVASFTVDLLNHRVTGYNGPGEQRYWAVLNDHGVFSLGRNSYTDIDELYEEYDDRFATLSGEGSEGEVRLAGA